MTIPPTMSEQSHLGDPGYETSDVHTGFIWIVAVGLVISVALVMAVVTAMFGYLRGRDVASEHRSRIDRVTEAVARSRARFPEPRLQVAPQADLAALRAREETELNSYGWVDRQAGLVRLPIERAMDLLAQRGLPVRGDPNAPKATRTPLDMQQARPLQRESGNQSP